MKDYRKQQLRRELQTEGANNAELNDLLSIAVKLNSLKAERTSVRGYHKPRLVWLGIAKPAMYVTAGLVIGAFLIVISQTVLPTNRLYAVQKLSDGVAMDIYPQYRATVMMRRAQQVNQLVASHASSQKVLAVLADYTSVAGAYRLMPHANYAAFEYCESNLQQASTGASPSVRRAIADSLQSLETT